MKLNILTTAIAVSGFALMANSANAGMITDHHGNVGYDTYDECVAAVKDGSAKFYTPYTYQNPKRQAGESSVKKMRLSEVTIPSDVSNNMPLRTSEYTAGACDLGVGKSNGRYGVSGKLVGKYVPFAPDMPVNVYMNRSGQAVRVTMQQCDNHFSGKFPTPVISELTAPPAQMAIKTELSYEPVVTKVNRSYRPSQTKYQVKEVIMAPSSQVNKIQTNQGTAVTVETPNNTVYLGNQANSDVLNNVEVNQPVRVIEVPNTSSPTVETPNAVAPTGNQKRVFDPNTGKYVILK